ncbi:MAG: saccharopine dehydrogenase NADP-binding domain-containing protein, partial [Anaerolineae bacterium]|nr:saccharopine dehydrogenase NADP-binding domain-containing protein [Anaerolineae bacterium]
MSAAIFILGGYGNTGLPTAELLLRFSDARVVLAGRNLARAQAAADRLNQQHSTDRVSAAAADASRADDLRAA